MHIYYLVILYNFDFIDLHTLFGYVNIFFKKIQSLSTKFTTK